MLNVKIQSLRDELNNSISNDDSFEKIYDLSVQLDELIAEYYRRKNSK